jgi:hypothetical protein
MGGHDGDAVLKMNLSRGRLKYKKGRMMRTSLLWIQPCLFIEVGVRLRFVLQNNTYLQWVSRLHIDSNLDVRVLLGKLIKSTFKGIWPHIHNLFESATINDLIQRHILATVNSFLYTCIYDLENRLLPNDIIMIRNHGEGKEGLKERRGGAQDQQKAAKPSWNPNPSRDRVQFGFQEQSSPKTSPRSHTDSVWDVLYMDGKIRG